ncbi:hypothetical protein MPR_0751 [Myroides profundi]|nr:hypothetical protein MPR_0751 [Myroides profundi]
MIRYYCIVSFFCFKEGSTLLTKSKVILYSHLLYENREEILW